MVAIRSPKALKDDGTFVPPPPSVEYRELILADIITFVPAIGPSGATGALRPLIPTLVRCMVCQGLKSMYSNRFGDIKDKELTRQVALFYYGYLTGCWEQTGMQVANDRLPRICSCACDHEMEEDRNTHQYGDLHTYKCTRCGVKRTVDSSG